MKSKSQFETLDTKFNKNWPYLLTDTRENTKIFEGLKFHFHYQALLSSQDEKRWLIHRINKNGGRIGI